MLAHDRRRIVHFNVTPHPTAEWTGQQLRNAFPHDEFPRYLLRDRDAIFGLDFREQVRTLGIEEVLSTPRSPWQRAYVERMIGSIRREYLDHIFVFDEASLRRILAAYFDYYNYASYCPPRYVVGNSRPFCNDNGNAGARLLRRTRSTNLAAASVSSAR